MADLGSRVGNTPLVPLRKSSPQGGALIWAKCEFLNPSGSVKDRVARAFIEDLERRGLKKGDTVVEATSGNTGVALAMLCAARGYKCVLVMPERMLGEKSKVARAYGADIVPCANDKDHTAIAESLAEEAPKGTWWYVDQYNNEVAFHAHKMTGYEIASGAAVPVDALVAGVGTGMTLAGVATALRENRYPNVKIYAVDPMGSKFFGKMIPGDYLVEGIGHHEMPGVWQTTVSPELNKVIRVLRTSDRESFLYARSLARVEGLLVGGASGAAMSAAVEIASDLSPDQNVVTIFTDTGRNYLSKFFDPQWSKDHGVE